MQPQVYELSATLFSQPRQSGWLVLSSQPHLLNDSVRPVYSSQPSLLEGTGWALRFEPLPLDWHWNDSTTKNYYTVELPPSLINHKPGAAAAEYSAINT